MSELRKRARAYMNENKGRDSDLKTSSTIYETYFNTPNEINLWFAKGDEKGKEFYIDLVMFPYTKNFPNEPWVKPYREGDFCYTAIQYIHKNVGPEGAWVLCPKANYLERCPICEDLAKRQKAEEDDDKRKKIWEELRTYRRQLYYIVVRDGGEEEDKGVQLWEVPTAYMHEKLDAIRKQGRSGEVIEYYDLDFGKTIKFIVKKKGEQFAEFLGHQFEERIDPSTKEKYVIEDEFFELACKYPIGDLLKRMTYDEVAKIYYAKSGNPEEEETPAPSRRGRRAAAPAEPEDEEPEETQPPATRGRGRPRKNVEEPEDDTTPARRRGRSQDDEEPEETPPTRRRRGTTTSDELDEPGPAKRGRTQESPKDDECPEGKEFGVDCLSDNLCDNCSDELFHRCQDRQDELKKAEEEKPTRRRRRA